MRFMRGRGIKNSWPYKNHICWSKYLSFVTEALSKNNSKRNTLYVMREKSKFANHHGIATYRVKQLASCTNWIDFLEQGIVNIAIGDKHSTS